MTLGTVTYSFRYHTAGRQYCDRVEVSLVSTGGESKPDESETARNLEAAINADPAECFTAACFGAGTVANASADGVNYWSFGDR